MVFIFPFLTYFTHCESLDLPLLLQMALFLFSILKLFQCKYVPHIYIPLYICPSYTYIQWLSNIPLHACTHLYLSLCWCTFRLLPCPGIVNSAARNIGVHVSFRTMVFSRYMPRNEIAGPHGDFGASLIAQLVKNLPAMQETWVEDLGSMPGKIPWRREMLPTPVFWPVQSMGSQRVRHN